MLMATFGPTATPMHLEEARMDQSRGRGKRKHRILHDYCETRSFRTEVHTLQTSPGNNWRTKFTGMPEYLRQSPEALRACISLWKNALQSHPPHALFHFTISFCHCTGILVLYDVSLECWMKGIARKFNSRRPRSCVSWQKQCTTIVHSI